MSSQVRNSINQSKLQSKDQYGRQQFSLQQNSTFQPPKPDDKPPFMQDKPKSKTNQPPPEKKKHLQPVDREQVKPEQEVGKEITITANTELEQQSAFYCKVCKVQLKDSQGWYDHINGKKHNQMLGMSMTVERVSVDKVKAKLASLKRKSETPVQSIEDITRRIEEQEKEEEEKKKKRQKTSDKQVAGKANDKLMEEFEFDEEDIGAFGLPTNFGSTKK